VRLSATTRAERGRRLLAQNPAIWQLDRTFATRQKPLWSVRFASARDPTRPGKEYDHGTAHGHRRRGDRLAQGRRHVPADRSKSAEVDQHRREVIKADARLNEKGIVSGKATLDTKWHAEPNDQTPRGLRSQAIGQETRPFSRASTRSTSW
jgi:hypothetical protein